MELLLLLLISASYLLCCTQVGVVGNQDAAPLPSEIFWKQKLPNTRMPAILHELLHPAADQQGKPSTRTNTISTQPNFQKYSKRPPLQQLSISDYTKKLKSRQLLPASRQNHHSK
ncbi:uncharacterized protein LOC113340503 [Papaver somniferum]|uniref:uncharacterized protein LOC113340503 n=1 Tax=Papaver somniferum TaxID=3469 RepID=UPI000E6F5665|nr:uncharacterized protein LOC113340503 [Papaver somniferum]